MTLAVTSPSPSPATPPPINRLRDDVQSSSHLDFAALLGSSDLTRDRQQVSESPGFQPEISAPGPATVKWEDVPQQPSPLAEDMGLADTALIKLQSLPETFLESSMFEFRATGSAMGTGRKLSFPNQTPSKSVEFDWPAAPVLQESVSLAPFNSNAIERSVSATLAHNASRLHSPERATLRNDIQSMSCDSLLTHEVSDPTWPEILPSMSGRRLTHTTKWQWSTLNVALSVIRGQMDFSIRATGLRSYDIDRLFSVAEEISRESDLSLGTFQVNGRTLSKRTTGGWRFDDAG